MGRGHRAGINASFLLLWEMSREEKARKGLEVGRRDLMPFKHNILRCWGGMYLLLSGKVTNSAS